MKNMIRSKKKELTIMFAIVLLIATVAMIARIFGITFADNVFNYANGKYIIADDAKLEVQFAGVSKKSATSVVIPATIKINEQEYKVTGIKAGALKDNKKIQKLTVGENVKVIGKKAFYGCKKLKNITIKTSNLTTKTVGSSAFKGLNSKAVVTVPKQKLASYKKILKAKGLASKKQVVKGKKMEVKEDKKEEEKKEEEVPEVTFGPDHPLPNPEYAAFSIGDITMVGSADLDKMKVTESAEYSTGDSIPFSAKMEMHPDIYGTWGVKESYGIWFECHVCRKRFSSTKELAIHVAMTTDGCTGSHDYNVYPESYTETYWIPDEAPCKVSFHVALPEGLSYQEDTVKLLHFEDGEIDSSVYKKEISGQELTVTIDDIKKAPFYGFIYDGEEAAFRSPIIIIFNAKMNDSTAAVNTAKADVSYNYKDAEKTIDFGNFSLYAASLQIKNTDASGNAVSGSKFALYKEKVVYSGNIGKPKFYKITEGTSIDSLVSFKGLSEGRYKLKQVAVPAGYEPMSDIIFNVSMAAKDGNITSLAVKDDFGENLPWTVDTGNGVISATIMNQ